MAAKPYRYNELSEKECSTPGCKRRLKKNVLARRPGTEQCYKCCKNPNSVKEAIQKFNVEVENENS